MSVLSLAQLAGFLAAATLITLAPGPDNLLTLSLGISRGRRAGVGFGLGCAIGCLTHTLWATLGVTALIAASETAFTLLKLAGGAYLVWLGIGALRSAGATLAAEPGAPQAGGALRPYLVRGFIANAINPKVALFFLAFLPQFVDPSAGPVWLQFLVLGLISVGLNTAVDVVVALLASRARSIAMGRPTMLRRLRTVAGGLIAGLGLALLFARRPATLG